MTTTTTTGVLEVRASVLVALAVVLCSGNLNLQTADAFQTTRTMGLIKPHSLQRQTCATIPPVGDGDKWNCRRQGQLFLTVTPSASATNATSTDAASSSPNESNDESIPSEAFFPPMESNEEPLSSSKRGRKRRAIQRMRENRFSRPIDSRLLRTLLFPIRILLWKPLWMVMDIMIARLDDDNKGVAVLESVEAKDSIDISTDVNTVEDSLSEASTATVETTHDSSDESASEEADAVTEQLEASILETEPEVATKEEVVNTVTEPMTASTLAETEPETVAGEDVDSSAAFADNSNDTSPSGDRWASAAPGVDLSGKWELIVTNEFKVEYDKYLAGLGQPKIVRSVALSGPVICQTMEELIQIDQGRSLLIRGKNIRGTWDRTLVASGSTENSPDFQPLITPIRTVDQELVESEAWWEDEGKSHVSWMRGVTMYGGGSFYSRRYFEEKENADDEEVYVCEGFFEFNDPKKERNELTWRFRRMAE